MGVWCECEVCVGVWCGCEVWGCEACVSVCVCICGVCAYVHACVE